MLHRAFTAGNKIGVWSGTVQVALIHPSAWKGNSANFAFTEF